MKIGILTLHWGTNYGGVLQSYALLNFLIEKGYDVEIINYAPHTFRDNFLLCFKNKSIKSIWKNILEYRKELNFRLFRRKYLNLSKRYYTQSASEEFMNDYDIIIVGSDQVWNPYNALNIGWPYWLPSHNSRTKKIAYATSLGCINYPKELLLKLEKYINDFSVISVRENSAVDIIQSVFENGFVHCMPDPTLLVNKDVFTKLIIPNQNTSGCFFYVLQERQKLIQEVEANLRNEYTIYKATTHGNDNSIEEWVSNIYKNDLVVTNSYHGVLFSILFHKKFLIIPIEGKLEGMNDRIYTILDYLGLNTRIVTAENICNLFSLISSSIDWRFVDERIESLKEKGSHFLLENITK